MCLTKHGSPTQDEHLQQPLTQPDQISIHRCFYVVKTLEEETIHGPNQHDHLKQYMNAKEK